MLRQSVRIWGVLAALDLLMHLVVDVGNLFLLLNNSVRQTDGEDKWYLVKQAYTLTVLLEDRVR